MNNDHVEINSIHEDAPKDRYFIKKFLINNSDFSFNFTDGIDEFGEDDYEVESFAQVNSGRGTESTIKMPLTRYTLEKHPDDTQAKFSKPILEHNER